jgi:uncharacterized membrane protein YgdD (TMEM256/DUF423 family)
MKSKLIVIAAFFGATAVILGALAAHQLKVMLSQASLEAFDKGVRYQMFHSLLLLFVALSYRTEIDKQIKPIAILTIMGICMFSFSIYLLSTQSITQLNVSFLGPITPIGGLCMIGAWVMLAINSKKIFND